MASLGFSLPHPTEAASVPCSHRPTRTTILSGRLTAGRAPPAGQKVFSRNRNYELIRTGGLRAFSPSGTEFVVNNRPAASPSGSSLAVTALQTGLTKTVYADKTRNVLAGPWSPAGDRIVFGIGGFAAFFDGFNSLFLKPADRIEDGAQVAIVNADGSGFEELTASLRKFEDGLQG